MWFDSLILETRSGHCVVPTVIFSFYSLYNRLHPLWRDEKHPVSPIQVWHSGLVEQLEVHLQAHFASIESSNVKTCLNHHYAICSLYHHLFEDLDTEAIDRSMDRKAMSPLLPRTTSAIGKASSKNPHFQHWPALKDSCRMAAVQGMMRCCFQKTPSSAGVSVVPCHFSLKSSRATDGSIKSKFSMLTEAHRLRYFERHLFSGPAPLFA